MGDILHQTVGETSIQVEEYAGNGIHFFTDVIQCHDRVFKCRVFFRRGNLLYLFLGFLDSYIKSRFVMLGLDFIEGRRLVGSVKTQ